MEDSEEEDEGGVILSTDEAEVLREEDSVPESGGEARAACGGVRGATERFPDKLIPPDGASGDEGAGGRMGWVATGGDARGTVELGWGGDDGARSKLLAEVRDRRRLPPGR